MSTERGTNQGGSDGSAGGEPGRPLLTVIVPVYNESATIGQLLERVLQAWPPQKQVVVVDDASTDGTAELLDEYGRRYGLTVLRHERNRGKGAAIRTGLRSARGRYTIIQDADLEYDPKEYRRLLEPLLAGQADVVYGSRRLKHAARGRGSGAERPERKHMLPPWLNPFYHGVSVLNLLVRLIYRLHITDEATCYKLFQTDVLRRMELECERFEFCPEVTAKAARLRLRLLEVPISYHGRSIREGKKIRLRDAIEAAWTLWRFRRWRPAADRRQR